MNPHRRTRSPSRRTNAAERGFTLVELLITVTLLLGVLGVTMDALLSITRSEAFQSDRNASLDSMRITLNRLTKELRQATDVSTSSTASYLDFNTYVNGTPTHLTYDASGTTLTRSINSGTATPVQDQLATTDIFSYEEAPPTPGAQWVKIVLQVNPKNTPDTTLVLDSEVNLRNRIVQ